MDIDKVQVGSEPRDWNIINAIQLLLHLSMAEMTHAFLSKVFLYLDRLHGIMLKHILQVIYVIFPPYNRLELLSLTV